MLRSSRRQAGVELVLALAGVLILLGACAGTGAEPRSAAPTGSLTPPAATAATSEAPSAGGGRGDYDYDYGATASTAVSPVPGSQVHHVNVATGELGAHLTGENGLTLYTFKPDSANTSTCADGCAQAWPPFTIGADDTIDAGDGVTGTLTTFARADGSLQVAYNGAPLYYFSNDKTAGDTNGQGLGDAWFVARP